MENDKLNFLIWLRCFSCLIVLFYHHVIFFWKEPFFCGSLSHVPVKLSALVYSQPFNQLIEGLWINLGQLGVEIFFIISGFLMALIANGSNRHYFLLSRVLRIWPAYIIALFLTLTTVYFSALYHGQPVKWDWGHLLTSFFLLRDIFNYPFIDGIVWTLELEFKFYLFCFIFLPWLINKPVHFLGSIIVLATGSLILKLTNVVNIHIVYLFSQSGKYFCLMGFGVAMSYHYQGKFSIYRLIAFSALLLSFFIFHVGMYGFTTLNCIELKSAALAVLFFTGCYLFRNYFKINFIINYLADISYSLYLVHGVIGFIVMYLLLDNKYSVAVVIISVLSFSILLAVIFHHFIEKPLLNIKKIVINKLQ